MSLNPDTVVDTWMALGKVKTSGWLSRSEALRSRALGTTRADGISTTATTSSAFSVPTWSATKPSRGGPARNAPYPIGGHDADPGRGPAGVVGGGAHPDREAERGAEPPQDDPGDHHDRHLAEDLDQQHSPGGGDHGAPEHGHAAEPVEQHRPDQAADGHRADEDREAADADPVLPRCSRRRARAPASRWRCPR